MFLFDPSTYSTAHLRSLFQRMYQTCSNAQSLDAYWMYSVQSETELAPDVLQRISTLLQAKPLDSTVLQNTEHVCVFPRLGTLSPWSSKATDIVHRCGLHSVVRVERGTLFVLQGTPWRMEWLEALYDPMTEAIWDSVELVQSAFLSNTEPKILHSVPVLQKGLDALRSFDQQLGLALSKQEMLYLLEHFMQIGRNPTDVELMMFAQANSEHCRHKIFNARWTVDGEQKTDSLFDMIRQTYTADVQDILSAYHDNAAVLCGSQAPRLFPDNAGVYRYTLEYQPLVLKVETHNHPTGISPYPGAATGSGGEIRDEGATGRGGKPKAALTGFSTSFLNLPSFPQAWENPNTPYSPRQASPLDIMLNAPLGAADFNNEFGRPVLTGYFRTFEYQEDRLDPVRQYGYNKPIMLAGGLGTIREEHVQKKKLSVGAVLIVLGGPSMLIGLGGGAASSVSSGTQTHELDFASVQRSNPEMQRRCQQVIDACWSLGEDNPILSIHDVGAGGLSNALPELLHDSGRGGRIDLRAIPSDDPSLSPLEIWCNESQERYVLAIEVQEQEHFKSICTRERCPFAIVGTVTSEPHLHVYDSWFDNAPIDVSMQFLFGNTPQMHRQATHVEDPQPKSPEFEFSLLESARRILSFPTVASKSFLITIADRSISGCVVREPMVGPWQIPVADVGVTLTSFEGFSGEAMALGERAPVAVLNAPASGRLAIGEVITNLAAARIQSLSSIRLSANWMVAAGTPSEDARLYETVHAVALGLCPALGIVLPVGKDSMSMRSVWKDEGVKHEVTSPLSLVVSGFSNVLDVRKIQTPQLRTDCGETLVLGIDLGRKQDRLGGSVFFQSMNQIGTEPPDVDDPVLLQDFFRIIQELYVHDEILAYHDRSDGGWWACVCEMAFAGRVGVTLDIPENRDAASWLFSEELGACIQIRAEQLSSVLSFFSESSLEEDVSIVGRLRSDDRICVKQKERTLLLDSRVEWLKMWSSVSHHITALRDDPGCVREAWDALQDVHDPGLHVHLAFDMESLEAPYIHSSVRPQVAILREQGTNGHVEMAAAWDRAGFEAIDIHMSDLFEQRRKLTDFQAFVACGGFSYGDVLGAGRGWAQSILFNARVREQFAAFFADPDTLALGVCNGCQMMAHLRELIPGAESWPEWTTNRSERFESRTVMVEIRPSPSVFFQGMERSRLPIAVAHGEGRVASTEMAQRLVEQGRICLQFVDGYGRLAERYPANPNGSILGITGVCNQDGRYTIMMPHPERVFRGIQWSWSPSQWDEKSPWMKMFLNARRWFSF